MSMVAVSYSGDIGKTEAFLKKAHDFNIESVLSLYAEKGVQALAAATPVDTGKTSQSWSYNIKRKRDSYVINWTNSNIQNGVPIALIIQYGHGTRNGAYVQGIDYINPALKNIFDDLANRAWEEVTK